MVRLRSAVDTMGGGASSRNGSIAIVHDYLNQPGGAERVVLEMARIWPQATVYTSVFRPDATHAEYRDLVVRSTLLDRLPVTSGRSIAPFLPLAFPLMRSFDQDLVVSSTSGWAHGIRVAPGRFHVAYCYSPPRWLHEPRKYFGTSLERNLFRPVSPLLRAWDRWAASRPDAFIAISENVRERLRVAYGVDSEVVYPPVDLDRFTPRPRGERLLVVSRLRPFKRVDLIVRAAVETGMPLDVVGDGPALAALKRMAGPNVAFHGRLDDAATAEFFENCSAVCVGAEEDFGLVPVEANAAGKPALAFGRGGAAETQIDGVTGVFFHEPTVGAVAEAMRRLDTLDTQPDQLARHAEQFGADRFREHLPAAIAKLRHD